MRVSVPEYVKLIANAAHELVLSRPAWYRKHGTDATLFLDAHAWPPIVVRHALRVAAAARRPDGQWVCVANTDEGSHLWWFDSIHATEPSRVEPVPFASVAADPEHIDPLAFLHPFGDLLLAIPVEGPAHVHDGTRWRVDDRIVRKRQGPPRTVRFLDDTDVLVWGEALYDARLEPIDARGCTQFVRATAGPLLAVHDDQLVEVTPHELVPRLPGHEVATLEPGPGTAVLVTLARDDERGTHHERALFEPAAGSVAVLPEDLMGRFPEIVGFTAADDLVRHDSNQHVLVAVAAAELAALPRVRAADLPIPPKLQLDPLDELGAASRPVVATARDHIVMIRGQTLRFHTVDAPLAVIEHARPLVAVVAVRSRFVALDDRAVAHEYTLDGTLLGSRPTLDGARSLAATSDSWIAIGTDRLLIVGDRPRTIAVAGPLAVAADPRTGELAIACEDGGLAAFTGGELCDLPPTIEPLVAIAALGERKFACLGNRNLYLLDLAYPELAPLERRLRRPHLASIPLAGRLATCGTPGSVEIDDHDGGALVPTEHNSVRYSGYTEPDGGDVTVHGLAFMDDGRLVIALDEGRGNIVTPDTGAALKLDPQPGDVPSRWLFICGGKILISD